MALPITRPQSLSIEVIQEVAIPTDSADAERLADGERILPFPFGAGWKQGLRLDANPTTVVSRIRLNFGEVPSPDPEEAKRGVRILGIANANGETETTRVFLLRERAERVAREPYSITPRAEVVRIEHRRVPAVTGRLQALIHVRVRSRWVPSAASAAIVGVFAITYDPQRIYGLRFEGETHIFPAARARLVSGSVVEPIFDFGFRAAPEDPSLVSANWMFGSARPVVADRDGPDQLTGTDIARLSQIVLRNSADVHALFRPRHADFFTWFNRTLVSQTAFPTPLLAQGKAGRPSPQVLFNIQWDQIDKIFEAGQEVTFLHFAFLFAVTYQEMGGFQKPTELGTNTRYLAYFFDRVQGRASKLSYNNAEGNEPAYDSIKNPKPKARFNQTVFNLMHDPSFLYLVGSIAGDENIAAKRGIYVPWRPDQATWHGQEFPDSQDVPASSSGAASRVLVECDFHKFRGRGPIHITWRTGYRLLLPYVRSATDSDVKDKPRLKDLRERWRDPTKDEAHLSGSTNADWNALFGSETGYFLWGRSIAAHNRSQGNYLRIAVTDPATLLHPVTGAPPGSVANAASKINPGREYRETLLRRFEAVCVAAIRILQGQ